MSLCLYTILAIRLPFVAIICGILNEKQGIAYHIVNRVSSDKLGLSAFALCEMNFAVPGYSGTDEFRIMQYLCDCGKSSHLGNPTFIRPKSVIKEGKDLSCCSRVVCWTNLVKYSWTVPTTGSSFVASKLWGSSKLLPKNSSKDSHVYLVWLWRKT